MKTFLARLSSILRSAARYAMVPVQIVVNGIKMLVMRPAPLVDQALDAIEEAPPPAVSAETKAARQELEGRESYKVQQAAKCILKNQGIPLRYLNPAFAGDAQKIAWLHSLSRLQLGILAMAEARKIEKHLNGVPSLPMPLVTDVDRKPEPEEEKTPTPANDASTPAGLLQMRLAAAARARRAA